MKVIITREEKSKLEYFLMMMKDESLPLSQRRVAKMHYDNIYYSALERTLGKAEK